MTILGIDPGLVATGWARLEGDGSRLVNYGTITTAAGNPLAVRYAVILAGIRELLAEVDLVAVEEVQLRGRRDPGGWVSGYEPGPMRGMIAVACAEAVILAACGEADVEVVRIPVWDVRRALLGRVSGAKDAAAVMVRRLVAGVPARVAEHVLDAAAVALVAAGRVGRMQQV